MSNVVFLRPKKPAHQKKSPAKRRFESPSSILADAAWIESRQGANAYTEYLRRHGRRPDPATARTIGALIEARVKADDGRLYPPLTAAEKATNREKREQRKSENHLVNTAYHIGYAIQLLAENDTDPEAIMGALAGRAFPDKINLDKATENFGRFVAAWRRRQN